MEKDLLKNTEPLVYKGRVKVPYTWSVGETGSRFFKALRDDKKILGNYNEQQKLVFVPPKKFDPFTFTPNESFVELSDRGKVISYTIRRYQTKATTLPTPTIYALIKLQGAHQSLLHILKEVSYEQVTIGMEVYAVFKEKRNGHILDIDYFRPIKI